jgi:hypothetical protein
MASHVPVRPETSRSSYDCPLWTFSHGSTYERLLSGAMQGSGDSGRAAIPSVSQLDVNLRFMDWKLCTNERFSSSSLTIEPSGASTACVARCAPRASGSAHLNVGHDRGVSRRLETQAVRTSASSARARLRRRHLGHDTGHAGADQRSRTRSNGGTVGVVNSRNRQDQWFLERFGRRTERPREHQASRAEAGDSPPTIND